MRWSSFVPPQSRDVEYTQMVNENVISRITQRRQKDEYRSLYKTIDGMNPMKMLEKIAFLEYPSLDG
jgi:hypothetical protein